MCGDRAKDEPQRPGVVQRFSAISMVAETAGVTWQPGCTHRCDVAASLHTQVTILPPTPAPHTLPH
eukprot:364711-Chlamydomonas_euryale.AAC.1